MASKKMPIAGMQRVKLSDKIPLDTPFTLYIFPTTFCNFKCVYCGHSLGHKKMKHVYGFSPENMTMETFNKIVEQAKEFNQRFKVISLTGQGEPLLHKNISEMVKIVKEADITERIEIITNASLLTPELSMKLIDNGLDCLRVSFQGMTKQKYIDVCGFDIEPQQIIDNIRFFYNNRKQCQLHVKILDVALEKDEDDLFYQAFNDISDRMFIESCKPVYTNVDFTDNISTTTDRYGREHTHRKVCPLCFFMLGIFPDGDVEPCDTIYKPVVIGNVNNERLVDMWRGDILKNFRLMQLSNNRCNHFKCKDCHAPDDVSHPEDVLDDYSDFIISKLNKEGK